MYSVLIVEDDVGIATTVKERLNTWGFDAVCVEDFKSVLETFTQLKPHLVLMDISLPFFSGYHWCEQLRKISKVPIIFISSSSDNMNIVMAVSLGADDFIAKPFDTDVLIAKVKALLRRSYDFAGESDVLQHKDVFLNLSDNTLLYRDTKIELTKNEYKILHTLLVNKGKIVSRERLMENLWQTDSFVDDNTLTVNINRLRKKMGGAGIIDFIATKVGVGYIID